MQIGAHVRDDDPLSAARERNAEVVQFFLADPQGWKKPVPAPSAADIEAAGVSVFIHSPYVVNVASLNNRIRIPSRKAVAQHAAAAAEIGAKGLIVHGGHVRKDEDPQQGLLNWGKLFERQAEDGGFGVPILIENTAGGDGAMARHLDMLARLWDVVGEHGAGFCLDTCHAFAAGWELDGLVAKIRSITGRIDLVHLNNSRDEFGSTRDRHANVVHGGGTIDPEQLAAVAKEARAPVVVETPSDGQADDIAYLREALS
ncbi:deoxyribonuclease-4 [Amycolatopsis bartoniae]|uniref:Deoxyribonuclease IV n=1 Tax=Amycolatopsis bartoniae TaxID=941986 RepID=A0A8H9ME17_9PSEU|nr:deoxyribonuclease IV [Amycolatopsis bartoniae]MBB2933172.1 deoxyribonuclease-4 [Amycolatopsis bartoniae]TVT11837.1 deoxyribonuclease IV [Amycolatopsis bartoniae]GHF57588.1 deoxyribonuclease IV [Amycolatopsis bartoniae]